MVGALLVAVAAVGVFATYLDAISEPATSYLLADRSIDPGTRFDSLDDVAAAVGRAAIDLPPTAAERAVSLDELERLVGHVVVAPLRRGDLVTWSAVVPADTAPGSHTMSFPVDPSRAVDGQLRAGERVDIVATYGTGSGRTTVFVATDVPLLRVGVPEGGGLGAGGGLTLTVSLEAPEAVLALSHAVATAELAVVRTSGPPGDGAGATGAAGAVYRGPIPTDAGGTATDTGGTTTGEPGDGDG